MLFRRCFRVFTAAVGLAALLISSVAFADAALDVQSSSAADGTVTATVSLDGNMTASGIQFALSYDSGKLTLTNAQNGTLSGNYTVNDTESGSVRVVWYNLSGQSVNGHANLLTLTFAPKSNGDTIIGFSDGMDAMVVDSDLNALTTTTKPAAVTVKGATSSTSPAATPISPAFTVAPSTPVPIAVIQSASPSPTLLPSAVTQSASPTLTLAPATASVGMPSPEKDASTASPTSVEPALVDATAIAQATPGLTAEATPADRPFSAPPTDDTSDPLIEVMTDHNTADAGMNTALVICLCATVCAGGIILVVMKKRK